MAGGIGNIGGTIVGAFVIGVINDGMTMCGVTEFYRKVIRGVVIILAVIIDQVQRNLQAKIALQARNSLSQCALTGRGSISGIVCYPERRKEAVKMGVIL